MSIERELVGSVLDSQFWSGFGRDKKIHSPKWTRTKVKHKSASTPPGKIAYAFGESDLVPFFGLSHKSFVRHQRVFRDVIHCHGPRHAMAGSETAHDNLEGLGCWLEVKLDTQS